MFVAVVERDMCRKRIVEWPLPASMAARSPPARPHIGIHPSNHFAPADSWVEDDAWDSASDSESPRQTTLSTPWNRSSSSAPKPVPKPASNASSSTLAFSYTHLSAPNPSSYPPRPEYGTGDTQAGTPPQKNGWTIVRTAHDHNDNRHSQDNTKPKASGVSDHDEHDPDIEVEGDIILGDLETEQLADQAGPPPIHTKLKQYQGSIKDGIDAIVNGIIYNAFP